MKVGISLNATQICEEWLKQCKEADIDYIEVSCSHLDNSKKCKRNF